MTGRNEGIMSKDMQKTEEKTNRRMPTFTESVTPIIAMMVILTVGKGYLGYAAAAFGSCYCRPDCLPRWSYLG